MKKAIFFVLLCLFSLTPTSAVGGEVDRFITVVNPVRIAPYTKKTHNVIFSQYSVIRKYNIPATWLLTYDSINDLGTQSVLSSFNDKQEIGIFLEITESLAKKAGVGYNTEVAWHYPNNVFLSGYEQEERERLIDTVFEKFKSVYGYYPRSIGSWWTDSYSLNYIKQKYAVVSNLTVADQYKTDNYQLWGQYWGQPFFPSSRHSGIPAQNTDNQIDIVMLQWAPRDPINGYFSSLYSTQDYLHGEVNKDIEYFSALLNQYLNFDNEFSQIVIGLEGDLGPDAYVNSEYEKQISLAKVIQRDGDAQIVTMSEFSDWFIESYENNPTYFIDSTDLLGSSIRGFWYNSSKYRVGLFYDEVSESVEMVDFRVYDDSIYEPYYTMPNELLKLSVYIPSIVDKVRNDQTINIVTGELIDVLRSGDTVELVFKNGIITLDPDKLELDLDNELKSLLGGFDIVSIEDDKDSTRIIPQQDSISDNETVSYKDLTRDATYQLRRKRVRAYVGFAMLIYLTIGAFVFYRSKSKVFLVGYLIVGLCVGFITWNRWLDANSQLYSVHREEIYALNFLKNQPNGKVLVVDAECVGCKWYTEYVPAALYNKRGYVKKYSDKPIIYSSEVFDAVDQKSAREAFKKTSADYIYLVKYSDYAEKAPFSPGDLGIEKIFGNAYSEIWRVVEK